MDEKQSNKVLILDTSAFLGGYNPNLIKIVQKTVPEVLNELKNPSIRSLIDISIETGKLTLFSPSKESIEKVNRVSKESGDDFVLSEVDIKILALALEEQQAGFEPLLITDDYSMQNIARKEFKINFKPVLEKGIKELIQWKIYCPGCKKTYQRIPKTKICPDCGTRLKRYSYKKSRNDFD